MSTLNQFHTHSYILNYFTQNNLGLKRQYLKIILNVSKILLLK